MIASRKVCAQGEVARDRAALDQRLPLPGPAAGHIVAQRGIERASQRPLFAVGAQPHVDAIGHPQRGVVGQQTDDVAAHPGKELGVRHDLGALGLAVFVVEEYQIDVGAVVELLAAELSQAQDDEPGGRAPRRHRHPESSLGPSPGQPHGRLDAGVGQVREVLGDHFQGKTADDVVIADAQALALAEPAQGEPLLVLVRAVRRRSSRDRRSRPIDPGAPARLAASRAASGSRIKTSLKYWLVLKTWSRISVVRGLAASSSERRLDPRNRGHEPFQIGDRHPGIGAPGQDRVELDRDPGERLQPRRPGPPGQVGEVANSPLGVANAQTAQPALDELGDIVVGHEPGGGHWICRT